MRRFLPLLGVVPGLAAQTGCAAGVWDARTFNDCDRFDDVVVVGGTLHVRDDEGDGCWIEVYGIDQLEVHDDRIVVGDADVWVHGTQAWSTRNARLDLDTRRLYADGEKGDYAWSPGPRRLEADGDRALYLEGDLDTLELDGDLEVQVATSDDLAVIEGRAAWVDILTTAAPERIDLDVDDDVVLYLSTEPTYRFDIDAEVELIDPRMPRTFADDGVPVAVKATRVLVLPNDVGTYYGAFGRSAVGPIDGAP